MAKIKELDFFDQLAHFQVWNPKWSTKQVLIACYKVDNAKTDHIKITFPKSNAMKGDWYASRAMIRKCPTQNNGVILCYMVDLDKLEKLVIRARSQYI